MRRRLSELSRMALASRRVGGWGREVLVPTPATVFVSNPVVKIRYAKGAEGTHYPEPREIEAQTQWRNNIEDDYSKARHDGADADPDQE